jgi:hypothetical protein
MIPVPLQIPPPAPIHTSHFVNAINKTPQLVAFAHAALFSPALTTLRKALDRNFLPDFPGLTSRTLRDHPPPSLATDKGHLDQHRKNQRPTPKPPINLPLLPDPDTDEDAFPDPHPDQRTHHCYATTFATTQTGKVFSDQTGRFLVPASSGATQLFVLYDYDSNSIHAAPMKTKSGPDIVAAYTAIHNTLVRAGLRPRLQRMDNECSTVLRDFLHQEDIQLQLVPPGVHRANAAERAIRTLKNHIIAGLCTTDPDFPLHLWDRLLPQALLTLNLLRASRINPKLSAYAQVFGQYSYNTTPIAPPGTHFLIHEKPGARESWAPHAVDAWYLGPAMAHYRCYRGWVWKTQRERIADTVTWKAKTVPVPTLTPLEAIQQCTQQLSEALRTYHQSIPIKHQPDPDNPTTALQHLQQILDYNLTHALPPPPLPRVPIPDPVPRVGDIPAEAQPHIDHQPNHPTPAEQVPAPPPPDPHLPPGEPHPPPPIDPGDIPTTYLHQPPNLPPVDPPRRSQRGYHPSIRQLEALSNSAINCDTGLPTEYRQLLTSTQGPQWEQAAIEEWARLAQGLPTHNIPSSEGTNTIRFIAPKDLPPGRKATYPRIVVADRPNKANPKRVRVTVGGDRITYPHDVATKTADLATVKILINSTISTPGAKWMSIDIKDFYLNTPMSHYEYMKVPIHLFPDAIRQHYQLDPLLHNGGIYVEIQKGMYGLPQAGRLANDELITHLAAHGYTQSPHTAGLFTHKTRPIAFCLVVDDFGIRYVGDDNAEHLIQTLRDKYTITSDRNGTKFVGLTIDWDYANRIADISMPDYIQNALQRFQHQPPKKPQHSPHAWLKPQYGATQQLTEDPDNSPPLPPSEITKLQQIIGVLLYYARAVDSTMLVALGSLASKQTKATTNTMAAARQLLDYAATHPDAKIRFRHSDMILQVHSDASYLSESEARSRAGGISFLAGTDHDPNINGAIHVHSSIMKNVLSSATEAEVGALFHNAHDACSLRQALIDLGHPQPPTPIQTDNACAHGILNDQVKQKRSKAMDMRYYWLRDRVRQQQFHIHWEPGDANHADYFTKHHPAAHHQLKRPIYLHPAPSSTDSRVC